MIEKIKITVWDYHDAIHGSAPWHYKDDHSPIKYEVEAWCLQGKDGFLAYFYIDDMLCTAHGDGGHWWLIGKMNKYWLKEFKDVVASIKE